MEEIDHEILMTTSSVAEDSDDSNMCLISKYCDYIESGGTVQYTNFKFVGINLKKNEAVRRFFCLCGKHVKILTIDAQDGYWYCDHPVRLCKECVGQQVINLLRSYHPYHSNAILFVSRKRNVC